MYTSTLYNVMFLLVAKTVACVLLRIPILHVLCLNRSKNWTMNKYNYSGSSHY